MADSSIVQDLSAPVAVVSAVVMPVFVHLLVLIVVVMPAQIDESDTGSDRNSGDGITGRFDGRIPMNFQRYPTVGISVDISHC